MSPSDEDDPVRRIFFDALDLPSTEWESFVSRACGSDARIAAEVLELLHSQRDEEESPRPLLELAANFASPIPPPRQIGRYRLDREIGRGGMGIVFLATDSSLGRPVAIKLLPALSKWNTEAVARFQRELAALGGTRHPNVVQALTSGVEQGWHYLVMEFVPGRTLDRVVAAEGPLSPVRACRYIRDAARGLRHLHERNVIHRDIKPANLILTDDDVVKILDFGLAIGPDLLKQFGDITANRKVLGSVDYIAPERQRGQGSVDPRADLYSLGATLYFLLTGRVPFAHHSAMLDRMMANATETPPAVTVRGPLRSMLPSLTHRLLAKSPNDRPSDAASVVNELDAILARLGSRQSIDGLLLMLLLFVGLFGGLLQGHPDWSWRLFGWIAPVAAWMIASLAARESWREQFAAAIAGLIQGIILIVAFR